MASLFKISQEEAKRIARQVFLKRYSGEGEWFESAWDIVTEHKEETASAESFPLAGAFGIGAAVSDELFFTMSKFVLGLNAVLEKVVEGMNPCKIPDEFQSISKRYNLRSEDLNRVIESLGICERITGGVPEWEGKHADIYPSHSPPPKPLRNDEIEVLEKKYKALDFDASGKEKIYDFRKYLKTTCQIMLTFLQSVKKAALIDMDVLILGERGTGKELAAKTIHEHSKRKDAHFEAINIPDIPKSGNTLQVELFGVVPNYFHKGSLARNGIFERCNGGTVFLDEIGDAPPEVQASLLRVIQEKTITKIGTNNPVKLNFRLIMATNKNLKEFAKKHNFREDLIDRIWYPQIHIPPLRERKHDIPLLVKHLLHEIDSVKNKRLSQDAMEMLMTYNWSGNVRELYGVLKQACFDYEGDVITKNDLPPEILPPCDQNNNSSACGASNNVSEMSKKEMEWQTLLQVLKSINKNADERVIKAAKKAKMSTAKAYRILDERGLTRHDI